VQPGVRYLARTRGIAPRVLKRFVREGRIYEAAGTHNCVFTGIEQPCGPERYCFQRSSRTGGSAKFESRGSDKRCAFSVWGLSPTAYVFEGCIDLLSFMSLNGPAAGAQDHLLTLGGLSDAALSHYTSAHSRIRRIVLCLDADEAGEAACGRLSGKFRADGFAVERLAPSAKDWNDQLLAAGPAAGLREEARP
jgi:hypothetical protein